MGLANEILDRPDRYLNERHRWLINVAQTADTDDCIEWPFTPGPAGYGRLSIRYKQTMATHVILELTDRPRPHIEDYYGAVALHTCDNPPCCNPRHLRWGTQRENTADMRQKQRAARGEKAGQARLTEEAVREIHTLSSQGWSQRQLGRRYGVSNVSIGNILRGKTWKHVRCATTEREPEAHGETRATCTVCCT